MWASMRHTVIDQFPDAPRAAVNADSYIKAVEGVYVRDAYHSLSIENYRVSPGLIERVRSGSWGPDGEESDREDRNVLAARGYWQAFQAVRDSLRKALAEENAGRVADDDHSKWYEQLFGPSVTASIIEPADLAGYRNDQVYIRGSMYTPPKHEAVVDCMEAFFGLLKAEKNSGVRVVLGHFIFVYIHPYMDGNGRMGRFLMNLMLASGGFPWVVIPVEERDSYMSSLESASVKENIEPFVTFLARLVREQMAGESSVKIPE